MDDDLKHIVNLLVEDDVKGAYLLVLDVTTKVRFHCGSLGKITIPKGLYLYVGSALGVGGVKSRVLRYFNRPLVGKWHIDKLLNTGKVSIRAVICIFSSSRVESMIYNELMRTGFKATIKRFGSTDTKDETHLLYSQTSLSNTIARISSILFKLGLRFRSFLY